MKDYISKVLHITIQEVLLPIWFKKIDERPQYDTGIHQNP